MRVPRQEYIELMTFGRCERQMFSELFGFLPQVQEEWTAQGASPEELSLESFDWDYVPVIDCGGNMGPISDIEPSVVEDTPEYIIRKDEFGRTTKQYKKMSLLAHPLDYPVKDMASWLSIKHMFTFHEERIDWDFVEAARKKQEEGELVVARIPGCFSMPRDLMGDEKTCLCYYDDPELMHDILQTFRETCLKVIERVTDRITIDQVSVFEDLAGKSGPLLGPKQIQEFVKPYFMDVWDLAASRGGKIFDMDSDGNVGPVLDAFLECGLTAMHPMEPAAGMDIVRVRDRYGTKLSMKGGINKFVLMQTKEDIRRELEYKMQPAMRRGGVVFGLDHRIPNGTPLENYRYYVDFGREILGLPPRTKESRCTWHRMSI